MSEPAVNESVSTVRDSLSKNVLIDIAARLGYLVTRFFIPPFVLSRVSLEAYGLWSTAFILVSYIGISAMGISNVNIKYVAEYAARKDYQKANQLLSTGLMISLPVSLAIFGFVWVFWPHLLVWLNISPNLRDEAGFVVLTVVAIFLLSLAFSLFRDALIGVQATATVQSIWVVTYLFETALILLFVGMGRGVRGLAEAFLLRYIAEIILSALFAFRKLPWLRLSWRYASRESLRSLFQFGGIVQVTSLFAIVISSIERAVAAPLIGLAGTGLLDIAKKLPSMVASIPSAFISSLLPAASYLQGGGDGNREAVIKLYLKGARYMNLATGYFCGFLACLAAPILGSWLGKDYPGAPLLMAAFCLATQVHLLTGPGTSILKGLGKPLEEFHYCIPNALTLVVFLPLSWLVSSSWTVMGIAFAVMASTLVSSVWFQWHANQVLKVPNGIYLKRVILAGMAPYPIAAVCSVPVWLLFGRVDRWTMAAIIGVTGVVFSLVCVYLVLRVVFDRGERDWFLSMLQSKVSGMVPAAGPKLSAALGRIF